MNFSTGKNEKRRIQEVSSHNSHTERNTRQSMGNSELLQCLSVGKRRALGSVAIGGHKLDIPHHFDTVHVVLFEDNNHSPGGLKQSGIILMV